MESQQDLYRFFLVLPPGFENLAVRELYIKLPWIAPDESALQEWQAQLDPETFPGGLEVSLPLAAGCALNQWLKIPARILIRLVSFPCPDWSDLESGIQSVAWEDWIGTARIEVHVSSRSSKLSHKRRLEQFLHKKLPLSSKAKKSNQVKSASAQGVFLRLFRDEATLSLDTSGELLHRRGLRTVVSQAPLRENIASGVLTLLTQGIPLDEWHRYQVFDPMAGAGTLLLEALDYARPVTTRDFQYECFPKFKDLQMKDPASRAPERSGFCRVIGGDLDARALRKNQETYCRSNPTSAADWQILEGDFFRLDIDVKAGDRELRTLVISNPPYGERLPVGDSPAVFLERFLERIDEVASPYRIGLILPARWRLPQHFFGGGSSDHPGRWESLGQIAFENGGLPVRFHVMEKV